MRIFGGLQVWLGGFECTWARGLANRLWTKIMSLDYTRRCQLAMSSPNTDIRIWSIRELSNFGYDEEIVTTCRSIALDSENPAEVTEAAKDCIKKTESSP